MNNVDIVNEAYTGRDFDLGIEVTDENEDPVDITNWTLYLSLRQHPKDTTADLAKTTSSHPNPTGGIGRITITRTESASLIGKYYYELAAKDSGQNKVFTIATGIIVFLPNQVGTVA